MSRPCYFVFFLLLLATVGCDESLQPQPVATALPIPSPSPTPSPKPKPLTKESSRFTEQQRKRIYLEIDAVEAKAGADAEARYPLTPPSGERVGNDAEITRRAGLQNQMVEDARKRYFKKRGITEDEAVSIGVEAFDKHWDRPPK